MQSLGWLSRARCCATTGAMVSGSGMCKAYFAGFPRRDVLPSFLAGPDAWHHGRYGFLRPLYLTVTCSEFARGVQDYGFFWKLTSGWIPHFLVGQWIHVYVRLRRLYGSDCRKLRNFRSCSRYSCRGAEVCLRIQR